MAEYDISDLHHGDFEKKAVTAFFCVTPVFLIARFISRLLAKQLGTDDWAALAAFAFTMSCNSVTLAAFSYGWGRHKTNLSARDLQICLTLHWVFQITYKLAVAMNKASILLLYLRIMSHRLYRVASFTLLAIVALFAVSTTIASVFQCVPVQKAWIKSTPGHCYNLVKAWYSNAVFSIVTDILILMLPMHMVYKLQRDKREKLLLYAVFGLGSFVTFTSVMRFFALKSAENPDTTYDITSGFWSVIEINVGVICICLPPLRALLSRHVSFFNRNRSHDDTEGPYGSHSAPSELITIGGGNGTGKRGAHKIRGLEDSEEELVYATNAHSVPVRDSGITKKTEFAVTETHVTGSDSDKQMRLKPWEEIHAS
ncbi:hypothetical protein BJ878DRAFT_230803 [Calycina marina]|uniref:Rhodopsin domain-containing protein n=1 Tax=Calycina marina TaxID=1763456 RepID=A0A9P8CBZ4_9HELO|nr:hypothetical protein BJ878DRAFT_230803 [Calycina marina]